MTEGSAGDHRSVASEQCEAVPASSSADFRGRVAEVCNVLDRSGTRTHQKIVHLRRRADVARHQEARIEPEMGVRFDLLKTQRTTVSIGCGATGANLPVPPPSDDTESVEWSVQEDSKDTVSLPEVEADILPFRAPQLRGAFASHCDKECPQISPRSIQKRT